MSGLAIITPEHRNCNNHPMMTATVNGRPWMAVNHLAGPLDNTERAVRKLAETLPESERAELKVPTSGGSQLTTFVSEAGALEIAVRSRSPRRLDFIRWVTTLATTPAAPALPSPELAALPARVDQLAALAAHTEHQQQDLQQQVDGLTSRLNRVEGRPTYKKSRYRRPALLDQIRPEDEAAFFAAWREQGGERTTVGQLALMCQQRGLLPSLRVNLKLLGEWLQGHSGVEAGRTNVARWVRLRVAA